MAQIIGDQNPGQPNDSLLGTADPDSIEGLSGNDTLAGGGGADTLLGGIGNDDFIGGVGADSIVGGDGFDWINGYQDASRSTVNINLAAGTLTLTDTQTGAATVDLLSEMEGGSGGIFADTFTGFGLDNRFMPLGGADSILGADGIDDFMVVDYGYDHTVGGSQGIVGNLAGMNGTVSAGSIVDTFGAVDTVMRIDAVRGSAFADIVTAGAEDLQFMGLDGADTFIGGAGFNEVRYDHDGEIEGLSGFGSSGIVADLSGMTAQIAGTIIDGYGDTDSVIGIESVRGTQAGDLVRAPDAGIRFRGLGGSDTFIGGDGIDSIDFRRDSLYAGGGGGVVVNLSASTVTLAGQGTFAAATARDGFGSIDQLKGASDPTTSVDNAWGTDVSDTLIGSAGANTLNGQAGADSIDGGAGDDSIIGGGGSDTLSGGEGNDTIEGGGGSDLALYSAGRNSYAVTSAVGGGLQISFSAPNSQDFVDIVRDVETFQFSNGTFTAEQLLANQNQAPTAVTFANVVAVTENAVIPSGGVKVADIVVTDDGLGTNTLGLSGADATSFAITGSGLFYVGGSPDFEIKPSYAVTVSATDSVLVTGASGSRSIAVTNVAETFSPYSPASNAAGSLANAILAGVPGITINAGTVAYIGADGQGSFYDGSIAGLGIGAGVLLTSGDGTPPLFNTSASYGQDRAGAGDAGLTAVLSSVFGGATASFDANVLSFSFTVNNPAITSISLNAVFATDEYPDFVDNYVDIAAVFVNGVNYAYFGNDAGRPLSLLGDNLTYFRNNASGAIPLEYDGISIPLSIVAPVTQGVNTIKIAVADTLDRAFDSALFISSLTAGTGGGGGIVTPAVYEISGTPSATEGGTLTFTVSRDAAGTASTVSYTLTGTAVGSDYSVAPTPSGEVTFAENELTKTIVLTTVSDALAEGTESVIVTLTQATNGGLISQTNGATTANILDGNQAPTAVVLSNTVPTLAENTSVPGGPSGGIRVADIAVTDDALGTNGLSLTGADAASFALRGGSLYFVGASPDFEAKASYAVNVVATDASLSASVQQAFTLAVSDVNEAPGVALANQVTALPETANTAARVKIADIAISDDALGTNGLSLSGADAASFEIFDGDLYLRAGTVLDAVARPTYAVTVNVDDAAVGTTPDASASLTLTLTDVNQAPTAVVLSNTVPTLAENTSVPGGPSGGIRVADIAVTDDALGTNGLSLTGADAASFALRGGSLYFVGASPDFEAKASYAVNVVATDASLPASVQQAFTLAITDVYEAPPPVIGGSGNDTLFGLGDAFTLSGGDGDDTYVIDSADDDVVETPTGGIERVYTRFSGTILAPNVENLVLETGVVAATGNAGGNEIAGNASGNVIDGAGGNDTVTGLAGADTLLGGLGLDRLFGGDGDDSVDGGADADQLIGGGGLDTLAGGAGDDWLWGEGGNDSLAGGDGNDQMIGQAGLDTMAGGIGNDSYTLDDAGDVIVEAAGEGTDTVFTTIDGQTLGAGVENLVLTGAAASGSGNGGANQLYGNGADNTLAGGAGNDTIVGGEGGDSLFGDADADLLFGEGGNDTLSGGEGVDQLVGGAGNDSILGGNGADLIWGDAGADTLDGGTGADFMGGGAGNDVYVLDDGGDVAAENAGEGTDTVLTGLADYVVGANIEIVTMLAGAVQVFGNETDNRIVGNDVANVIVGGAGADTLEGGGGDDWLFGDTGGNVFVGGAGNDTMVGSSDFATDVFRHNGAADGLDYIYGYDVSQGDVIDLASATYDVVDNLDYFSIEVGGVEIIRVFSDLADGVLIA